MKKAVWFKTAFALVLAMIIGAASASAAPWSFGVMSDTQWKANLDGENPDTVAVGIIKQLNQQFINAGVKFVIQVGDLTDISNSTYPTSLATRAAAAQALYDAGIGFYPLRGNHEGSFASTGWFLTSFPQTLGSGPYVSGATNFTSPFATLNGLSYSFDFNNARFVLLDQFKRTDNTDNTGGTNNNILDQQSWIDTQLSTRPDKSHAFVFSHKNLIGQNHADDLFGSNPSGNPAGRSAFIASLQNNGVRYQFGGHDHMHHRAIIESPSANPDGTFSKVQEIICASDSYKFYIPQNPSNDTKFNIPAFGDTRETPIMQELFFVGYYIVTVDGPRVTVDYYASPNGCDGDCDLTATPILTFSKRETFGYSLNGKEFLVPQGGTYTAVEDSYRGTTARILSGVNTSTAADYANRSFTKAVDTGWSHKTCATDSNILSLWGMSGTLGSDQTDVHTLSMTYDDGHGRNHGYSYDNDHDRDRLSHKEPRSGLFGLATKDSIGNWINAVDRNYGGTKKFVFGPWRPGYELGTYGVDPHTDTVWAVINHTSDFAAAEFNYGNTERNGKRWEKNKQWDNDECRDFR